MTEGTLNRLVRVQPMKGEHDDLGKLFHQIRIDKASPYALIAVAIQGNTVATVQMPMILSGLTIAPRRSFTIPAPEVFVRSLGLRKGTRLVGLDLSGL